jgi:hypothetical protein
LRKAIEKKPLQKVIEKGTLQKAIEKWTLQKVLEKGTLRKGSVKCTCDLKAFGGTCIQGKGTLSKDKQTYFCKC